MRRWSRVSVPAILFAIGIALVVGVFVTNVVHTAIEHSDGIQDTHGFTSHAVRVALGSVVILGLFSIASGFVWVVATRKERRRHL